jgi:integrase
MLTIRKRGSSFHADLLTRESRVRGSLGTRNQDAARRLIHRLETALSEGAASTLWFELRTLLPRLTFVRFAEVVGFKDRALPTWENLRDSFVAHLQQRIKIDRLSPSTAQRYKGTMREFECFLGEQRITLLQDIKKPVIESFKVWRIERIEGRKHSRGGGGLVLDVAILHRVFAFALENEMISKNPVRSEGRPGDNPERGAQPFAAEEILKLRDHAGSDLLAFLLLRWTGFRGSDAVTVTWAEVHFDTGEIERVTRKRKKRVILPIHQELLFALQAERDRKSLQPCDTSLLNPRTSKPLTRPRLYQRMLAAGRRAGVSNAHPHRFRDTFAVDMLIRGASPYDVAKMLGDTIDTVERHYMPFVKELRQRVRTILGNDAAGLEATVAPASQQPRSTQ